MHARDAGNNGSSDGAVEQWLREAQKGSSEALGHLLERCRNYLLLVAREELEPALRAKAGSSDLVQETFLEARRSFDTFQGRNEAELLAWMKGILLHRLADVGRRYRTGKRNVAKEVPLDQEGPAAIQADWLMGETTSIGGKAARNEEVEALEQAIARLSKGQREVFQLRHRENLSFEEIGRRTNRSTDAACKVWARVIQRLERELRDGQKQ